ncbi:DNA polymerase IV [Saccharopolyspora rectivirgula]|uniref:DNA polymerase IV n=1 Tax=Saccharopolyspora rectivirgula TaxID=28042 RepID=UPI00279620A9|nr:DNA polymerase IV [Saccharopolyspora rectivirgula]
MVLHVDLDQFVVAVELLRHPELRGKPVLVGTGGPDQRGVVAGASYEARERGVHSGTPLRTAAARCPEAVFLLADQDAYLDSSAAVMQALGEVGGVLEVAGWDEAFLLVTTANPQQFSRQVQQLVHARTQLHCSVGIGDNKLRAKIASALAKPAGVFRLDAGNWVAVMADKPTEALLGVGLKTARRLEANGIRTVGELARAGLAEMAAVFGPNIGPWLVATAYGYDSSPVTDAPYQPRSHGHEVTYQQDLQDPAAVRDEVVRLAALVVADLDREGLLARRVVVKVRDSRFATSTHGVTLPEPTRRREALERAAVAALERFRLVSPLRLIGVRAELVN